MPRYRRDDSEDYDGYEQDKRGVHRRRLERKGSNTPIIIGAVIIGVAILGILIAMMAMGRKEDPEEKSTACRSATESMVIAAISGDRARILDTIEPTGPNGNITVRLGVKLARKYRFWDKEPDVEAAKVWRIDQDDRMVKEVIQLAKDLALTDLDVLQRALSTSTVKFKMNYAELKLRNMGGEAKITLLDQGSGRWKVQNWETVNPARGT